MKRDVQNSFYYCFGLTNNDGNFKHSEYLFTRVIDHSLLYSLSKEIKLVIVTSCAFSSHILNYLRYISYESGIVVLMLKDVDEGLIPESAEIIVEKNRIVFTNGESSFLVQYVESEEQFNDTIEFNCSNSSICFRPHKQYNIDSIKSICEVQTSNNWIVFGSKNKLWYQCKEPFIRIVRKYVDERESYVKIVNNILRDYKTIISDMAFNNQKTNKAILYRSSPFVGYFINPLSYAVYSASPTDYSSITLAASKTYNLSMSVQELTILIDELISSTDNYIDLEEYALAKFAYHSKNEYGIFLFVITILSDIRRTLLNTLNEGSNVS